MAVPMPASLRRLYDVVQDEDQPALARLQAGAGLKTGLEEWLPQVAQRARSDEGESWASIGNALAITRQAAQQRFGGPAGKSRARYNPDPHHPAPQADNR